MKLNWRSPCTAGSNHHNSWQPLWSVSFIHMLQYYMSTWPPSPSTHTPPSVWPSRFTVWINTCSVWSTSHYWWAEAADCFSSFHCALKFTGCDVIDGEMSDQFGLVTPVAAGGACSWTGPTAVEAEQHNRRATGVKCVHTAQYTRWDTNCEHCCTCYSWKHVDDKLTGFDLMKTVHTALQWLFTEL